jgi:hypothetical protein
MALCALHWKPRLGHSLRPEDSQGAGGCSSSFLHFSASPHGRSQNELRLISSLGNYGHRVQIASLCRGTFPGCGRLAAGHYWLAAADDFR